MPRQQSVTAEALERLGVAALANLLVEHAAEDPVLARKVRLLLAGTEGARKLSAELGKRIRTIGASHSYIDWEKRRALVQELDHLRRTIAETLAAEDRQDAIERMWEFVSIADRVLERTDSGGHLEDVFNRAMADLGRLYAAQPKRNPLALARRVIGRIDANAYGASEALIQHLSEALGPEGRAEIQTAALKSRAALPALTGRTDWQLGEQHRHLAHRLALLADLDGDADAYISALRAAGLEQIYATAIAERLIRARRPAEALEWLASIERTSSGTEATRVDLRVLALESLGRTDEAQAARWEYFRESLSVSHLREYLKLLPDFEDFEAEQRAFAVAASYLSVETALGFFIEWPNLDFAARIIRDRESELDGRAYTSLRPAAQALEAKYPAAATRLYRLMVESVLYRGASQQYPYAADDLKSCVRLAPRTVDDTALQDHASFLARLRSAHGRKHGFWNLMADERR